MVVKTKKRKKSKGQRGQTRYGHGARKKWAGSGGHGGKGMSGTGKRADHKKSLVIKLYGNKYFGKQGITSKGTKRKKNKWINLRDILLKYPLEKEINLKDYKVLGDGEINKAMNIKAKAFTTSAKNKIEKAGGKAIIIEKTSKNSKENKKIISNQ
jgi:large subunit ribosomal protein L15